MIYNMSCEWIIPISLVHHDENGDAVNVKKTRTIFEPLDIQKVTFLDLATIVRNKYPGLLPETDYIICLKNKDIDGDVTASQDRTLATFFKDAMFGDCRPRVDFVIPMIEVPPPPPPPPLPTRLTEIPVSVDTTSSSSSLSREVIPNTTNNINDHNSSGNNINSDVYITTDQLPSYGLISASAQQRQSSTSNIIDEECMVSSPTTVKPLFERRNTPMGHLLQLFLEQDDGEPYIKYPFWTFTELGIHLKNRHDKAWKDMNTGNTLKHFLRSNPDYFQIIDKNGGQGIVHLKGEHGSYKLIGEKTDKGCPKGFSDDLGESITSRPNINPSSSIRPIESRVVMVDTDNAVLNTTISHSNTINNNNHNNNHNNDHSINNNVPSKVGRVVNLEHNKIDDDRKRQRSRSRDNSDRGRERGIDRDRDRDRSSRSISYRGRSNSPSRGRNSDRTNHPYGRSSPVGHRESSVSSSSTVRVPCRHFSQDYGCSLGNRCGFLHICKRCNIVEIGDAKMCSNCYPRPLKSRR